jgi:hypothetical protein
VTRRHWPRPRRRAADLGSTSPERAGWLERLARLGYVAKGAVYLALGGSGLLVAVGLAEQARGSPAAMRVVMRLPLGYVLGAALVAGLVGYAALSFVAAARDPEGHGRGVGGVALRLADGCTGVAYTGLAATALRLLVDPRYDAGDLGATWSALLFRAPGGAALLVAAGVVLAAIGAYLWVKAATAPFAHVLERRRMRPGVARWIVRLARAGTAARGVLFALCGGMLVRAGWRRDPGAVGDFGDALTLLGASPAGPIVLALVALGCVAYGAYQLAKARFRRVYLGAALARARHALARRRRAGV